MFLSNYTKKKYNLIRLNVNSLTLWNCVVNLFAVVLQVSLSILGFPFDIRQFHSSIMELGSVPLWLLEKVIDEWIKAYMTSSGHVSSPTPVTLFATMLSVVSVRLL